MDADKLVDVDVAEGKGDTAANTFIDDGTVDGKEEGTWGRLKTFGRGFITNVAAYSVADDVYTLTEVENASNRVTYSAQEQMCRRDSHYRVQRHRHLRRGCLHLLQDRRSGGVHCLPRGVDPCRVELRLYP